MPPYTHWNPYLNTTKNYATPTKIIKMYTATTTQSQMHQAQNL